MERRQKLVMKEVVSKRKTKKSTMRPALSPDIRESQMIGLAMDVAEQQMVDGTASSQVITHFLKLGSSIAKLEKEELEKKIHVLEAKVEALQSSARTEELYANALAAMKSYSGADHTYD